MKLTVKNFGPIHEAKNIDVKPMTIFVGPSNTGKSYLAALIYSVMKALKSEPAWAMRYVLRENIRNGDKITLSYNGKEEVVQAIDTLFHIWATRVSNHWQSAIVYCFGEIGKNMLNDENDLFVSVSGETNKMTLDLTTPIKSILTNRHKESIYRLIEGDIEAHMWRNAEHHRGFKDMAMDHIDDKEPEPPLVDIIVQQFLPLLWPQNNDYGSVETDTYYLPAIRGSMVQNHRAFVSKLLESAPTAGLDPLSPIPTFTGVLSDFTKKLVAIADAPAPTFRNKPKKINRIGKKIENQILEGEIEVRLNAVRYPEFRYQFTRAGKKYDLPMINTSAMVSELAPIPLFIRYYAKPDDTFIIEEPEAHLHPAAQNAIADTLVQLVNAGVHVMLTTHSDNILEKIGNCVLREKVGKTKEEKTTYTLPEDKTAVYLFQRSKRSKHQNTVVNPVQFSKHAGFVTEDHLEVTSTLYNETIGLMDKRDNGDD